MALGLRFIKRSQLLGLSLNEVEPLLSLHDGHVGRSSCAIAKHNLSGYANAAKVFQF
jgi:MerR family transcriptional regulator, mercuric resistance operon regulatory protein